MISNRRERKETQRRFFICDFVLRYVDLFAALRMFPEASLRAWMPAINAGMIMLVWIPALHAGMTH